MAGAIGGMMARPRCEEKAFEDYHLYTLPLPTTIHDRETKQVEFLHASGIQSKRLYVYDGARFDRNYGGYQDVRQIQQYGTQSNPHVWVMREFANSDANHLGVPSAQGTRAVLPPRSGWPGGIHRRKRDRPHAQG